MPPKRREYLTLLALGGMGALAGCIDDEDDDAELEPVDDDDEEDEEIEEEDDEEVEEEDNEVEEEDDEEEEVEEDDEEDEDELRQMDLSFGDTVEHPDEFHITTFEPEIVDSYEVDTRDGTETIEPENEQFVFIEIEIENVSDGTIETPNGLDFEAIVDNQQYERLGGIEVEQPDDFERYPSLQDLAPGSIASGELIYDTTSGEVELFYSGLTEDFDTVEAIWS